ncbi:MAG: hypothetical protein ACHQF4_07985 [Sphingobacteriales bacterium]
MHTPMHEVLQIIATKKKSSTINGDCRKADVPMVINTPKKNISQCLSNGGMLNVILNSTKAQNINMVKMESTISTKTAITYSPKQRGSTEKEFALLNDARYACTIKNIMGAKSTVVNQTLSVYGRLV